MFEIEKPKPALSAAAESAIEDVFSYHTPTLEQIEAMHEIRESAKSLARAILKNAPSCADRSASVRKVREAMMTANAAIILEGRQC